jgi:hypothetical protein
VNRGRLIAIVGVSLVVLTIVIDLTRPAPSDGRGEVESASATAHALEDLDAPTVLTTGVADGTIDPHAPPRASELVWLERARGTAREALFAAVASTIGTRVHALPDAAAIEALLTESAPDAGVDWLAIGARFPASEAADPAAMQAVSDWLLARGSGVAFDETWLLPLAHAAGDGPSAPLAAALAARQEPREVRQGLESLVTLSAARLRTVRDDEMDLVLTAHAAANGGETPHEGLANVIVCAVAEAEIVNGGFSQLTANEPELALTDVADGYRRIGLSELATLVDGVAENGASAGDDLRFDELVDENDPERARARYVRALFPE